MTEPNGIVITMTDDITITTRHNDLVARYFLPLDAHYLVAVTVGDADRNVVYVNPAHVIAVQPAIINDQPTEDPIA